VTESHAHLDFIAPELLRPEEWDRQWLQDFRQWYGPLYFYHYSEIRLVADIRGRTPAEVYALQLCSDQLPLWIWVPGDELVGRNVLEIGCGPGLLGKQLGLIVRKYLGIDQSPLAVRIARGVSPPNCTYLSLEEADLIACHAGQYDVMVGRFFFIHQNEANAAWVLRLARLLLADGGRVWADFYASPDPDYRPRCVDRAADRHVTSGYAYSREDVRRLAEATGFEVERIDDREDILRRFAALRRC